jgi:hypothetical protein
MIRKFFSILMVLLGATNISFASFESSLSERESESVSQADETNPKRFHVTRAFETDDVFHNQEDSSCPDTSHEICHTCHFGHCSYTLTKSVLNAPPASYWNIKFTLQNDLIAGISLSGPIKPPRA